MFRNYLVTALRNMARHKLYSFINISGLAIGLACVIFVLLFIRDELSYDKWVPDTQNLYRVEVSIYVAGRDPTGFGDHPFPDDRRDAGRHSGGHRDYPDPQQSRDLDGR